MSLGSPLPNLERGPGLRLLGQPLVNLQIPGLLRRVGPRRLVDHPVLGARLQHFVERLGPEVLIGVERSAFRAIHSL